MANCLDCGHEWSPRSGSIPRQCPTCWSYAVVGDEEIKTASIFLKPLAYLSVKGEWPSLPQPHEIGIAPIGALHYATVISKAKSTEAKKRAIRLMLAEAGFTEEEITKYTQASAL